MKALYLAILLLSNSARGDALLDAIYSNYFPGNNNLNGYYNEDDSRNESNGGYLAEEYEYDERDNSWRLTEERELIIVFEDDCR